MDNPQSPLNNEENNINKEAPDSVLSEIIKVNQEKLHKEESSGIGENTASNTMNESTNMPKRVREPMSLALFMKLIGSLFLVAIIFFGSFLAYIVLNPSEALFFANTFSISPKDIAVILYTLIRWSFGTMLFIVSIVWIITLFRALWTPKDLKRKRLLNWLVAGIVGILVFSITGLWAFLYRTVGATEWDNLEGSILLYDSDIYKENKELSQLNNTANLIGPINILFDIRSNALLVEKRGLYTITGFSIDFDGARCSNGRSTITGSNPKEEQSLVCTFDTVKSYSVRGKYTVTNRIGETETIDIVIPDIEIRGLIDIKKGTNIRGKKIITLDAKNLEKLGNPRWIYKNSGKVIEESSIIEEISGEGKIIGLKLWGENIDRIFILKDEDSKNISGEIIMNADPSEERLYQLSLSGISLNPNEIADIQWQIDSRGDICPRGSERCEYRFSSFGKYTIRATITLANGQKYELSKEVDISEPLRIIRHVKVMNKNGILLNPENTYDKSIRAYKIENAIIPPEILVFDARDIVSANPGFVLESVKWKISNGKRTEEKEGGRVEIEFPEPLRYEIEGIYTFKKEIPGNDPKFEFSKDKVIIDVERKNITPKLDINISSDYVPSTITVDASQSRSDNAEIKKFIFDFGEGKPPAEGDAIKQYTYTSPGEKTITLTVIDQSGNSESVKKSIVLKGEPRRVNFVPSIQPGVIGNPVDFEALGTNGQVKEYIWNFGDNTPVSRGYSTSHTFTKPGKYMINLTVIYEDGTEQSERKSFEVVESLP